MSETVETEEVPEVAPIAGIGTMVFGKWDATEVVCSDPGLAPYINLRTIGTPHSGGRHANAWFGKDKLSVIERFINNLMRTGKFSGKKQHCAKAFEAALDNIAERTGENPLHQCNSRLGSLRGDHSHQIRRGQSTQSCRFFTQSSPRHGTSKPLERLCIGDREEYPHADSGNHLRDQQGCCWRCQLIRCRQEGRVGTDRRFIPLITYHSLLPVHCIT